MIYFTSDPHYHHANIMKYCSRPFSSVEEMDEEIIKRWNSVVGIHDTTYILGDLIFTKDPVEPVRITTQLNGKVVLIKGNHDHSNILKILSKYIEVYSLLDLQVKDEEIDGGIQRITLCHYPMLSWNCSHRGAWQLFGHHHGSITAKGINVYDRITANQLDVGVDSHDFYPVSYERVKELITKQNLKV